MSCHFSRLNYDGNLQEELVKQTTGPGNYRLYGGQYDNEKSCHALNGSRNNRVENSSEVSKGETLGDRAEIESVLKNFDRPASKATQNRTMTEKNKKLQRELQKSVLCDNFLNYEYTRLEHPIDDYRGLSTISLQVDYPLTNPVDYVFNGHNKTILKDQEINSRSGRNTRLESKDLYSNKFISINNVDIENES